MDELFEKMLEKLKALNPGLDEEKIRSAYIFARDAHEGQLRKSGEPYIIHPIAVAEIIGEMGLDSDSIIAALMHKNTSKVPSANDVISAGDRLIAISSKENVKKLVSLLVG